MEIGYNFLFINFYLKFFILKFFILKINKNKKKVLNLFFQKTFPTFVLLLWQQICHVLLKHL